MTTIYCDIETYYDKDYSLSKMSTEEYIRDTRFKVHGFAYCVDDGSVQWVFGPSVPAALLCLTQDHPDASWCAHNAMFDMAILSWHYNIRPRRIVDTLSMARLADVHGKHSLAALSERYGLGVKGDALVKTLGVRDLDLMLETRLAEYCRQDVKLLRSLHRALDNALRSELPELRYKRELALIDCTVRMFTEPVLTIDAALLQARLAELEAQRDAAVAASGVDLDVLMSNQQFAAVLAARGIRVPASLRKTDPDLLALKDDPRAAVLIQGRLAAKSVSELRRTAKFLGVSGRGTMPVPLKYYGAHTGRWSGSDGLNMQNLNKGSALRRCLTAPDGYVLVVVDSSQIEARVLAWLAGQYDLLASFAAGEDVYVLFAQERLWPGEEIDEIKRFVGKTCILGLGYGVGHAKLHAQIVTKQPETTLEDAQQYVVTYRNTYKAITRLWKRADGMLRAMMQDARVDWVRGISTEFEKLRLPSGRALRYPGLRLTPDGYEYGVGSNKRRLYGAALVENIVQAIARDIVADQMLAIRSKYRVVTMTHDEIVFLVREGEADEAFEFAKSVMRAAPSYAEGVPLNCAGGYARNYSK
jgi:DNA polymerase